MRQILCVHQGSELYGSDRSFRSAISSLRGADCRVEVVLPSSGPLADQLLADGVSISFHDGGVLRKQLLRRPLAFLWDVFASTCYFLRRFRSQDVIYVNTVVMLAALLAAVPYRLVRKRVVCHVREIPSHRIVWAFRMLLRLSGAHLLYNSEATKRVFGLAGTVIHNGVEDAGCVPPAVGGERTHVLLIGRINAWKGQSFLLEALAKLPAAKRGELKVRIVGSPFEGYEYLESELARFIEQHGLGGIVELHPFAADPSHHFSWATYVIVPSTLPEPFGRVAVEGFSHGKPVIAAAHGGLTEIVVDGQDGFLFEPGCHEALASVLSQLPASDAPAYQSMRLAARHSYESRFSLVRYQSRVREYLLR